MRRLPSFRTAAFVLALIASGLTAPAASADTLYGQSAVGGVVAQTTGPIVVANKRGPEVSGRRGVIIRGVGYAPSKAPDQVKAVIWAANRLRHKPYKWGGGHGRWKDSGYDCSGAVSYALHGGGLLDYSLASGGFMKWGARGEGKWITVYATTGHAYMIVAGIRFDTSGAGQRGPRWRPEPPWERHFKARHPVGF
jgi:hypothetical protein